MVPLVISGLLAKLAENGLGMLASAVTAKGKQVVEEQLGIDLDQASQTEEGLFKLKELTFKHEEFLITAGQQAAVHELNVIKEDNANTASARRHDEEIQKSPFSSDLAKNTAYILDFVIIGTTFIMMIFMFFKGVPPENKEFFYMALGSLLTMCVTVVNFHRGSSQGSKTASDFIKSKIGGV